MDILIREQEGADDQPYLLWDTVWNDNALDDYSADWKLAGPNAPNNKLGLQANHALHTAILLCLFTWRRAEPYDRLPAGTDPKGWWGDYVDIDDDEQPLGSKLWLLFRSPLNAETERRAIDYCTEALQPLINQGVVSRFEIEAEAKPVKGQLIITVRAYGSDGQVSFDQRFERVWRQEFPI